MKKSLRLTTALLATTAIVIGAFEIESNLVARLELHTFLDRHPGISIARVVAEPLSGQLVLSRVAFGTGATRVTIGRLALPMRVPALGAQLGLVSPAAAAAPDTDGTTTPAAPPAPATSGDGTTHPAAAPTPAPTPAPQAKTDAGSADDVTITDGPTTVRIKHLELTGTSLSKADIAAIFDPKNSEPAEARFKKLTATAIIMPEVAIDTTSGGTETHATLSQVVLSGVAEGKIAAGSASRTVLASKTGDDASDGEIGAIQATNLDLVQVARVFNTIRSDDAEPIRPLYDAVTVTGLRLTDKEKKSTISLGLLRETGVKARPLATDFFTTARTAKPTDAQTKAAFNDMLHSSEVGTLEADDLAVKTESKDGVSTLSVANVSLHDLAKQKIGGFKLRALHFDSADAKFGIGTIDLGAVAIPDTQSLPTSAAESTALMPVNGRLDVGQIDFDGVTKDKDKLEPSERIQFKLNHIGYVSDGTPGDLPKASKLNIDNLIFDVPPGASQAAPLAEMGYKRVDLSAALSTTYNPSAQELTLDSLSVNGVDMGSAGIGLDLLNVTKGIISPNKEIARASALAILVKGLKLDVTNAGLFDRALTWKAKQDGVTVDQERTFAVDYFSRTLPAAMNNNANVRLVGDAIAKFCAAPKGLHISIVSKNGLGAGSLGMLSDPGLLLDTLDVKATND